MKFSADGVIKKQVDLCSLVDSQQRVTVILDFKVSLAQLCSSLLGREVWMACGVSKVFIFIKSFERRLHLHKSTFFRE